MAGELLIKYTYYTSKLTKNLIDSFADKSNRKINADEAARKIKQFAQSR